MSKKRNTAQITTPAILKAHTFMYPVGTLDISKRLMEAVEKNDFETVKTLVVEGADVNITDKSFAYTYTPLCLAVQNNNKKMTELLLKSGADVNYPTQYGDSALTNAVKIESYELVKLLLAYGADADIFGSHFHPFNLAMKKQNIDIAKLLLSSKLSLETEYIAFNVDSIKAIKFQLEVFEKTEYEKNAALFYAVASKSLEIIKLLLSCISDPNIVTQRGSTPLEISVRHHYTIEAIKELLKAGTIIPENIWSRSGSENPQVIELLVTATIADKIASATLLNAVDNSFICQESLSNDAKTIFIERAGKLLATKASNEADFFIDADKYEHLPYLTQIGFSFYQQLAKFAVDKIAAGHSLLPAEKIGLLEIKTNPIYKEVQKEFITNLSEKIAKNYKKFGETLSAEKYSDILRAELVKEVNESKEIKNIKDEVLSYFVDIISNLLGYEHIPPAEALDEGDNVSAKYEILRKQIIEAYGSGEDDKINLTNKVFAIIQKAIENPVKSLFELLASDGFGIRASIDSFLREPSMGVIFDERQANIYRSLYEMNDKGIISNSAVKHLIAEHFGHFFRGFDVTIEAGSFEESHAAIDTPAAGGAGASAVDKDEEGLSEGTIFDRTGEEDGDAGLSDFEGQFLLAITKKESSDKIKELVAFEAKFNDAIYDGMPILCLAIEMKCSLSLINKLIAAKVNIEEATNLGATPLHKAAIKNRGDIVKVLLDAGAKIDSSSDSNSLFPHWTPLHFASYYESIDAVKALLIGGASIDFEATGKGIYHSEILNDAAELIVIIIRAAILADNIVAQKDNPLEIREDDFLSFTEDVKEIIVARVRLSYAESGIDRDFANYLMHLPTVIQELFEADILKSSYSARDDALKLWLAVRGRLPEALDEEDFGDTDENSETISSTPYIGDLHTNSGCDQ